MSELQVKNVFEVDLTSLSDPHEQKAVTAMQATALMVQGSHNAADANSKLISLSQELRVAPTMTYEDLIFKNPLEREVYVMSDDVAQAQMKPLFMSRTRKSKMNWQTQLLHCI